jgi:periplasmic protein TonB
MAWSGGSELFDPFDDSRERLGTPFAKSILLHLLIAASIIGYAYVHNFFHGSEWGSNNPEQGAIQATLVSSAALPLPQDRPPTDNVLATENPSPAPEIPQQKAEPVPLPEAIPIPQKPPPVKPNVKPHTQPPPTHPQAPPQPQNKAVYGEAAPANVPRAAATAPDANNPVAAGGDFGSLFPWYVDVIKRKVAQNWYTQEVQPGTAAGASVTVAFDVARDGTVSGVRVFAPSGVPSLDSSCLHAVQRVDSFGPLPAPYRENSLRVTYFCTYPGH